MIHCKARKKHVQRTVYTYSSTGRLIRVFIWKIFGRRENKDLTQEQGKPSGLG